MRPLTSAVQEALRTGGEPDGKRRTSLLGGPGKKQNQIRVQATFRTTRFMSRALSLRKTESQVE